MSPFGEQLRDCRRRCRDPLTGRPLSQERLGELLGVALGGGGYSGQSVSNWERGNSKPGVDERTVLVGLLNVLHNHGGLSSLVAANDLLAAGNYRPLNDEESRRAFPGTMDDTPNLSAHLKQEKAQWWTELLFSPTGELGERLKRAAEGPEPSWPRVVVALLRWRFDPITPAWVLQACGWFCICLVTYWALAPSLNWPFTNPEEARVAMVFFFAASLITPLCVGALTFTRSSRYWAQHHLTDTPELRLYTHQGAFVGFYLGYMAVLVMTLAGYYLRMGYVALLAPAIGALPVGASHWGARLVPHNLWRAYGRLDIRDGAIFFLFVLVGPLWSYFFLQYYPLFLAPVLGPGFWIFIVSLMAGVMTWRRACTTTAKAMSVETSREDGKVTT